MTRYGIVNIKSGGEPGALAQDFLLKELAKSKVIRMTKSKIRDVYETDRKQFSWMTCNFVLHNDKETDEFKRIMRSPELKKDYIRWRTTTRLGKENEFRKWLEKRGVYEDV